MREEARLMARNAPVYRYYFTDFNPNAFLAEYGVVHGAELPYLFASDVLPYPFTDESRLGSYFFKRSAVNFARYGNPNGFFLPYWPRFDEQNGERFLQVDFPFAYGSSLREANCDFWANPFN